MDNSKGSLDGLVGGGGGADGVSNIMAEYFVDLKTARLFNIYYEKGLIKFGLFL